ncbi:MAG: succinate dehydrogenase iron-sulfur subunit [Vulcanimicrobiaceae bacterium]
MTTTVVRVRRYDPQRDRRARWVSYPVERAPKMSVLDALFVILEREDDPLAFRYSCRAGMCGSCAMRIDGREGLACRKRLADLGPRVSVEPLRSLPLVKDLLVDMAPFFSKYRAASPAFVAADPSLATPPTEPMAVRPDAHLRDVVDRQIDCISCGACYSACPTVAQNPAYLGPAALNRAYALGADVRDAARSDHVRAATGDDGVYACRSVGNCATVCPAGVDPLLSIVLLRKRALDR